MCPLPTPPPTKKRNVQRPPSMVYTSPESLKYIHECDRDATVNFDQEKPVAKWGRGGGMGRGAVRGNWGRGRVGEVEVQDQEEVEVQDQEEV